MASTAPVIPVVTYDYTQASDKFSEFIIPPPPTITGPPGFVEAINEWAADPQSSTVAKLYERIMHVTGHAGFSGMVFAPSYVYLTCKIERNDGASRFHIYFRKYPLRQKGYSLYSFCGDENDYHINIGLVKDGDTHKYQTFTGKGTIPGPGKKKAKVFDGRDYWEEGQQSPRISPITILYHINGTFMTILDEEGNPIEGFTGPPQLDLTASQFNDKLVLMYVEMFNKANEQWNQKMKMIEFHRQQMLASIEATYAAQLGMLQSAKVDGKRALFMARGEQIYNIEGIRQSELIRIDAQRDNDIKGVELGKQTAREQYELDCQKAYIEKCQRNRGDGQRLAAKGKGGGQAESARAGNVVNYQQRLNELLRAYNAEVDRVNLEIDAIRQEYNGKRQEKEQEYALIISDITAQYNMMILDSERQYDNQIADFESRKAESIFSVNLDYEQMAEAETMYHRYYEKELQYYFEDLKITIIEV